MIAVRRSWLSRWVEARRDRRAIRHHHILIVVLAEVVR